MTSAATASQMTEFLPVILPLVCDIGFQALLIKLLDGKRQRCAVVAIPIRLQEQLARARGWVRAEVERVFAEELASADRDAANAVEVAVSFEAWDQLRAAQGLSAARTAATSTLILRSVLAPAA